MDMRADLMLKLYDESKYAKNVEEANILVGSWILLCNFKEEFNYLKSCVEGIKSRYLYERYSYEKTGSLSEDSEEQLRTQFNADSRKFDVLFHLIDDEKTLLHLSKSNKNDYHESDMQKDIINNFSELFPQYKFIRREFPVDGGKIDILAKDIKSNRDVIIELKIKKGNPNRQLLDYQDGFFNPILVGITQEELPTKLKKSDITYYTFDKDNTCVSKY